MSAIEFAQDNAGRRFDIPDELLPNAVDDADHCNFAQVVGHFVDGNGTWVIIEFEELQHRNAYCWPLHDGVKLTVAKRDMYNGDYPLVMAVDHTKLKKQKRDYDSWGEPAEPVIVPKPYPSTCKACNEPARVYGRAIMCSSRSCKTRTKLLKKIDIKPFKASPIRCPLLINGKACNGKAVYYKSRLSYSRNNDSLHHFTCQDGHNFSRATSELKENDVVLFTLGEHDSSDRIWNGKKWEMY